MIRLAIAGLKGRPVSTALAALGLATAVVGFVLLAGTTRTTEAVISGDIARTWRGPYQLLVRPLDSQTRLEQAAGLVRPNYLAGLHGGITAAQLEAVRSVPNVEVAAPIAIVGFVSWPAGLPIDLSEHLPSSGLAALRVTLAASGEAGLSTYPPEVAAYLLAARDGRVDVVGGRTTLTVGESVINCDEPLVACWGGQTPDVQPVRGLPADSPGVFAFFPEPFVIAGVDPAAEAALVGLDRCVTSGRYLGQDDDPREVSSPVGPQPAIPVLVSERSFIDEVLRIQIEAADPAPLLAGASIADIRVWDAQGEREATADDAYRAFLPTLASGSFYDASPLWSVDDVTYEDRGPDHLAAIDRPPDPSIYRSSVTVGPGGPGGLPVPPESTDSWFRGVERHDQVRRSELFSRWDLVGQFDPSCIPGFDPLGGGRLESYALPEVRLPDGRVLGATRSPAAYVSSPPLVLVTLNAATWFADPQRYLGAPEDAFISAIRVRVAGADVPDAAAQARLARAAADIRDATGLEVDIVAGSSPREVLIDLPAGEFGRPAVSVTERWSVKGVALRFASALSAQDLAIFALVLVVALLFVAEVALLTTRRRRSEFAVLRALGWSGRRVVALVEIELLVLGGLVGAAALGLSAVFAATLGADVSLIQLAAAIPLAIAIAIIAGAVPAIEAGRATVVRHLDAQPPLSRGIRSVLGLAMSDLVRSRRVESALAISAIAIGAGLAGGIALVAAGFAGALDTTLLGVHLSARVRPFHVVIVVLTLVVAALAAGTITTIGYLERQPEFAALRALGWPRRALLRVILGQAAVIGVSGGLFGALATMFFATILSAPLAASATASAVAALGGLLAAVCAGLGPALHAVRSRPGEVLRGE